MQAMYLPSLGSPDMAAVVEQTRIARAAPPQKRGEGLAPKIARKKMKRRGRMKCGDSLFSSKVAMDRRGREGSEQFLRGFFSAGVVRWAG